MPDSLIDIVFEKLQREKKNGNPLVGHYDFSTAEPTKVIEAPYFRAEKMFPRVSDLIKNAKQEVLLCFFKFQYESDGAKEIIEALKCLKHKADTEHRRVTVKFIINQKTGIAKYVRGDGRSSPINVKDLSALSSEFFDVQIAYHEHRLFNSTHAKMVVCDGKEAVFLTGDPTFKNAMDEKGPSWVEVATVCRSPAIAEGARRQFISLWNSDHVRLVSSGQKVPFALATAHAVSTSPAMKTILFLGKTPSASPRVTFTSPYKIALLHLLEFANKSVKILVNNINDRQILNKILSCTARGVSVELVMGRYHCEDLEKVPYAGGTNIDSVNYLLRHATSSQQKLLKLHWACEKDGDLVQNMAGDSVHAKVVIVDERVVLTGSSLMDKQSSRSGESDILFESKALAKEYTNTVFTPVYKQARPVQLSSKQLPLTREDIRLLVREANSIEQMKDILNAYIYMREYENKFTGLRSMVSLFCKQTAYDRASKIETAKKILSEEGPVVLPIGREGLLGSIYAKYVEIAGDERGHRPGLES